MKDENIIKLIVLLPSFSVGIMWRDISVVNNNNNNITILMAHWIEEAEKK